MLFSQYEAIWLYPAPIDFRKGMDSLTIFIADELSLNPASGQLFLFRDRSGKKIKLLWWERNGFWLFYKRLEKGRLKFPSPDEKTLLLTRDQLHWLLSGLDYLSYQLLPEVTTTHFY